MKNIIAGTCCGLALLGWMIGYVIGCVWLWFVAIGIALCALVLMFF